MLSTLVISALLLALAINDVSAKRYASGGSGGSGYRRQVVNGQVIGLMEQKVQHGPDLAAYMADNYAQCSSAGNSANRTSLTILSFACQQALLSHMLTRFLFSSLGVCHRLEMCLPKQWILKMSAQ